MRASARSIAHAHADTLGGERLGCTVALDRKDVEADAYARSIRARVGGREIAEDPVFDLIALRLDADCFSDQEIAVTPNIRIANEKDDALVRQRRRQPSQ